MRTAAELADGLNVVQMLKRPVKMRQIKRLGERQGNNRFTNIVKLFNAAHAASGTSGQRPSTLFKPHKAAAGEFDLHFETVAGRHDVHAVDLLRMGNDAFREGETDGEQLEIFRRGHHHHMRNTVVNQRNGDFFRQKIWRGI